MSIYNLFSKMDNDREWSAKNVTEETGIETGTYNHLKYELYLQHAINRIMLNTSC